MSTRVLDRVEGWQTRRFDGLQRLAANEFSGVVRAGETELFMTSGVAVALRGGDIDVFEETAGTAYSAPSPALPLLAVMQERSDEVRDQFYTEQTPLSTVDETLSQGGFTGYVELSENVLSGDYYLVYHAGTSMTVGFVGQSGRLVDGREAFETATDEVGIYEVRPVTFDPVDLPEPAPEPDPEPTGPDDAETAGAQSAGPAGDGAETGPAGRSTDPVAGGTEAGPSGDEHEPVAERSEDGTGDTPGAEPAGAERGDTPDATAPVDATDTDLRTIPSVDPDRTVGRADGQSTTDQARPGGSGDDPDDGSSTEGNEPGATPAPDAEPAGTDTDDTAAPDSPTAGERLDQQDEDELDEQLASVREERDELDEQLASVHEERDELDEQLASVREERDELDEQLASVREERDELDEQLASVREERDTLAERLDAVREERDALRRQLDTLGGGGDSPAPGDGDPDPGVVGSTRDLTHSEAVEETAVFVRYDSQGDVRLGDVHSGDGDRGSLRGNLQLEVYGGFDGPVTVEGEPYEAFVERTLPYEFVEWVLTALPFEIRETGNRKSLSGLYDALPSIDHADLDAAVERADSTESFEVVFRDQRGQPLLVATIDSDREPVGAAELEQLVAAAERVGTETDSLAGAFHVTRGYFDGGALDVADEATQGRLLSRNRQKSFVSLSRKRGYHLCLVEAREGSPHLTVPEL